MISCDALTKRFGLFMAAGTSVLFAVAKRADFAFHGGSK
jgi:hypothetical protein